MVVPAAGRFLAGYGVVSVDIDRRAGLLSDGVDRQAVIKVAVGQEDGLTGQFVGFDVVENDVADSSPGSTTAHLSVFSSVTM